MRALMTGARGFIGSHLTEALLQSGFQVRCLLRKKSGADKWLDGLKVEILDGDITKPESLVEAVKGVDYVFHLAGATKAYRKEDFDKINYEGTKNLLDAIRRFNPGIRRFVHVSSLAVVGPSLNGKPLSEDAPLLPVSNYGRSKLKAENAVIEYLHEFPVSIIRPPAVYGPRDKDLFELFKYAQRGRRVEIVGGTERLSLIYVKDLVNGILLAAEQDAAVGKIYFICNDEIYSAKDLGNQLTGSFGTGARSMKIPLFVIFLASCAGELYGKLVRRSSIFSLDKYREIKQISWICDNTKAKKELGFNAEFSLEEGIRETTDWYLQNGWL